MPEILILGVFWVFVPKVLILKIPILPKFLISKLLVLVVFIAQPINLANFL